MVDLDAVDGKLKTQAVKMMLIHKFLDHPIPAPSLAPQDPTPTQVDWIDEIVYKNYLGLLMVNYCKHATTTIVDPEVLKINQKIITLLAKAPNHTMTQRDIFLKVKNRTDIKYTRDLDDYIIALRDNGIIKIRKHGNGITAPVYCSWIATTKHVEQS